MKLNLVSTKVTPDNLKINGFYVNENASLFFTFVQYVDGIIKSENMRYCLTKLNPHPDSLENESYTTSYKDRLDLVRVLNSYSSRQIDVEVNEIEGGA